MAIEQVTPSDVGAYRLRQLTTFCNKHGRRPLNERQWMTLITAPLNRLLRHVFVVWPPGSEPDPIIEEFPRHLVAQGFSTAVIPSQLSDIRCFLRYLKERRKTLASVEPEDVSRYLNARVALYRRRNGRLPQDLAGWRHKVRPAQDWIRAREMAVPLQRCRASKR
jgi:hypothetical protein